jgi:hypothetical protein
MGEDDEAGHHPLMQTTYTLISLMISFLIGSALPGVPASGYHRI